MNKYHIMSMYKAEDMENVGEELGRMVLKCKKNNELPKVFIGIFFSSFIIYLIISML